MLQLTRNRQTILTLLLALLMLATRGHHYLTPLHLPDASWAIFFLGGLTLRSRWLFGALFVLASVIDYVAITWGGVSSFCVTGAYLFLLPAYGALWFAGRSCAGRIAGSRWDLIPYTLYALAGTLACELLSSGGFYYFSGRFAETSLDEFAARLAAYLPGNLQAVALYLGMVAIVYGLFSLLRGARGDAGAHVG
jgi:hypothetical protein